MIEWSTFLDSPGYQESAALDMTDSGLMHKSIGNAVTGSEETAASAMPTEAVLAQPAT